MKWAVFFLTCSVIFNTIGNSLFKASAGSGSKGISTILLITGLLMGAVNAFFYTKSLNSIKLSTAYPVFSAGSMLLIALVSALFFKEAIEPKQMIGMFIIGIGIFIISN